MNIRNVLTVYTKLRNFTDDESALLETLRAMNDSERELLVETLSPQKSSSKKPSSKSAARGAKSKRASSLRQQISTKATTATSNDGPCGYSFSDGTECQAPPSDPIHDETFGYAGYHPFVPAASTAERSSSANGAGVSGTASSATQPEDVSNVHHAGG